MGGSTWGRIKEGWISLYYVEIDVGSTPAGTSLVTVNSDNLKIRESAGVKAKQIGTYARGAKIMVYETTTCSENRTWGRTDKGWICMEYVK